MNFSEIMVPSSPNLKPYVSHFLESQMHKSWFVLPTKRYDPYCTFLKNKYYLKKSVRKIILILNLKKGFCTMYDDLYINPIS